MRIIKPARLKEFWESRKSDADVVEDRLRAWQLAVKLARWMNFAELKQTLPSADAVGDCIVFDVGNNHYRLIGRINYRLGIVYVLKIMDHKEYDKGLWIDDCGCRKPRPKRNPKP